MPTSIRRFSVVGVSQPRFQPLGDPQRDAPHAADTESIEVARMLKTSACTKRKLER